MAFSEPPESTLTPQSAHQRDSNNDFQPFFVLHKGSTATSRKSEKKVSGKIRRRIDLSSQNDCRVKPLFEEAYQRQFEGFEAVWSKIESTIKDVLVQINLEAFDKIHCWIRESFDAICSCGTPHPAKSTRPYPLLLPNVPTSKQLYTAFVFTKNMELVDDVQTFASLASHLKSRGCHVAKLLSSDLSTKNGVGGCLRSLLRQFLMVSIDAADISILASWYSEQGNYENPVVVIIDDLERCSGRVLSDFIIMLREWAVKVPIILIVGVATTLDAPQNILASDVLHYLLPSKFFVGFPSERMDAVLEAVLVKYCAGFSIGHKVATFLRNYFLNQDGTLTSFIRALKIAVMQHFSVEPLSLILRALVDVEEKDLSADNIAQLFEETARQALEIQQYSNDQTDSNDNGWENCLSKLHKSQKLWSSVAMCLYEAGKYSKVPLLDLYCDMLDPEPYSSKASCQQSKSGNEISMSLERNCSLGSISHQDDFIGLAISKIRVLSHAELQQLLQKWEQLTEGLSEIHKEVKELRSLMAFEGNKRLKRELKDLSIHAVRTSINAEKDQISLNEKAAMLMNQMIRKCVQPIECIPFHEAVCFQKVDKLQSALLGDPRRRIQLDLLEFPKFLKCSCCTKNGHMMSMSKYDTSVMYTLAQEHGDLINLHDWFLSFKATVSQPQTKPKHRSKQLSPKGKNKASAPEKKTDETSVQARFCRAVTELQLVGLLRMPSKRRPDYVQRVAFGL